MADGQTPYPVTELLRAVQAEIDAVLHDDMNGTEKLSLQQGRQVGGSGDEREYLFSCRAWKESFSARNLLIRPIRSKKAWEPADVARMPDGKVRVVTAADLGVQPQGAFLVEDDTAGLEAIAERLEQAGAQDGQVNPAAAGWIVGQGRPRLSRCATPERFIRDYPRRTLNTRQRQAVEHALGSEVTFIWGPPGTGKTEVVGCVVEGCFRQDLRVLFLAPTHVAVDQALERMCELLSQEEGFDSGLVQRAGDIAVASLSAKYGDQIVPERVAERLAGDLDRQIDQLTAQLTNVRDDLAIHDEAEQIGDRLQELHGTLQNVDQALAETARGEALASAEIQRVERQIAEIGVPSGLFAQRKQARLDELHRARAHHHHALEICRRRRDTILVDGQRSASEISGLTARQAALQPRLRDLAPAPGLRDLTARFQERLSHLQGERKKITDTVRGRCRVMGTTVSKAVQSRKLMDSIDVVVIDEAGMVNLPSAWCAAGLAGKRVVVAGDFRQLPAVTRGSNSRSASPAAREHSRTWMDRDTFHAAGLVDAHGTARSDPRMVSLNEQYRMRPAICSVVNEVAYYDSPLITGRGDTSRLASSPLIESPLVLVDTSSRQIQSKSDREAHKSNPVHEAVIHELIRGLQYDEVLPARKWTGLPAGERPSDRLAVISPYKRQKDALNVSLKYRFGEEYEGLVDTVHRFQGSQRPLVVIDTVAGAGDRIGYFYEGAGLSSSTCRLLNVALSRAQDHLIVVADVDFMLKELRPDSDARRMLGFLADHAHRLPVDDLVPVRSAADLGGLPAEELARPAFFPADEVARAIEWDIAQARQSIDIYCAFLASAPVRKWLGHLSPRIATGIRVTVHTRQPDPGSATARLTEDLRTAGCQVSVRERMHEKVMIIDDSVLWHGSLNLLAHSGSTDLMMRLTDPTACERVRRIVERARMDRPAQNGPWQPPSRRGHPAPQANGVTPGDVVNGRLYLMVPFEEKDEAKRLVQARWDRDRRLWHVDQNVPRDSVRRWLPPNTP